jgi:hypothetical protein
MLYIGYARVLGENYHAMDMSARVVEGQLQLHLQASAALTSRKIQRHALPGFHGLIGRGRKQKNICAYCELI